MSFDIRLLQPDDMPEHRALMEMAFGQGRVVMAPPVTPESADPAKDAAPRWGLYEGGRLLSAVTLCPFEVHWGAETVLSMGGIAGVATMPEARGAGYVDALLRHALETMRDAGQTISALYPFSWSFYQKFGWDAVGERRKVRLPLGEIRKADAPGRVERVNDNAHAALSDGYSTFARRYRGAMTTDSHRWERKLASSDDRIAYVYRLAATGEYLLWRYDPDGKTGRVREWAVWTAEGHRAMLELLRGLATQCEVAEIEVPADSPLGQFVMHWDVETKVQPVFAARIVDVAGAVGRLPAPVGVAGNARVAVLDSHAPWTAGVWEVSADGTRVHAETVAAGGGEPDMTLTINALSQAFWGTPSLGELRGAGRVDVRDEAAYDFLSALLPGTAVYTLDFF